MPRASIVVPAYNTLTTLPDTVASLLAQEFDDFEVIVVDDGSSDGTAEWVRAQTDPRLRLVRQINRGLAGARNGGIAAAWGDYVGFCDGDDLWEPGKLAAHVAHLDARPEVGLSFSGARLIGEDGRDLGLRQRPKVAGITARDLFLRNPVSNGSTPVIRRACLDAIAWRPAGEARDWWFDESFRQSEDIECWLRIMLTTRWEIAGLDAPLTRYRIVASGLSANLEKQHATWERVADRVRGIAPDFARRHVPAARAYQLRYLARRAVSLGDGKRALSMLTHALKSSPRPLVEEPLKTLSTLGAAIALTIGGRAVIRRALGARVA
ncbi:glycosyltransferase family A protein [Roseobacter sp. HKCCA0434]|uniref:glycosyltransferase family 2 protein n=1 Tax=Roseobacter sp. HKCCA0434 TaxID=3079297 RepID=UPI002905E277|nr:glycosyltransferase family A protein [Roseobacter sp. HKCCA0434]